MHIRIEDVKLLIKGGRLEYKLKKKERQRNLPLQCLHVQYFVHMVAQHWPALNNKIKFRVHIIYTS
jgi:hypothetical protein